MCGKQGNRYTGISYKFRYIIWKAKQMVLTKLHPFNTASIIPASKAAQLSPPAIKQFLKTKLIIILVSKL